MVCASFQRCTDPAVHSAHRHLLCLEIKFSKPDEGKFTNWNSHNTKAYDLDNTSL